VCILIWVQHKLKSALYLHQLFFFKSFKDLGFSQINSENRFNESLLRFKIRHDVIMNVFYYLFNQCYIRIRYWIVKRFLILLNVLLKLCLRVIKHDPLLLCQPLLFLRLNLPDVSLFFTSFLDLANLTPFVANLGLKSDCPWMVAFASDLNYRLVGLSCQFEVALVNFTGLLNWLNYLDAVVANSVLCIEFPERNGAAWACFLCLLLVVKLEISLTNSWFELYFFRISGGQIGLIANFWSKLRHVNLRFNLWLVIADLG
jgi:hypothetical protein